MPPFFCTKIKNQIKNQKKMEKQKPTTTEKKQLTLDPIKNTPFCHTTDGNKNYITCGKVIMETQMSTECIKKELQKYPWEKIGMFVQAICTEMIKENNENLKK